MDLLHINNTNIMCDNTCVMYVCMFMYAYVYNIICVKYVCWCYIILYCIPDSQVSGTP